MEQHTLYQQIASRTGGSVYIGIVGPVRTGKSTFIKRFMEQLVLPNIENTFKRERAKDELPQSGSGRMIMTAEPKFVPEEAVEISPDGKSKLNVRLIDSVGYLIPGAAGAEEDGKPRMVTTPWVDHELPLPEAAELGTKKVMEEHSSIGVVMTTDGTITGIPREDYEQAEARAITDMKATGKPFLVLVNSQEPKAAAAQKICADLENRFSVPCMAIDAQSMDETEILEILQNLLSEFPFEELQFYLPGWVQALDDDDPIKIALYDAIEKYAGDLGKLSEAEETIAKISDLEQISGYRVEPIDLGTGTVTCELQFPEQLFYEVLSRQSGLSITNDGELMKTLQTLSDSKREYDKVAAALEEVRATGYGVVMPSQEELTLDEPQIIRKNGNCCVQLTATAPSIHMMRADIQTKISPMVGGERESEQLISYLQEQYDEDSAKLWDSNIFGKSLYELVSEGFSAKIQNMPVDARLKMAKTLARVINENSGGLICIML